MKSGMLFWILLVCAHTFTADQLPSSGSDGAAASPSDEELLEKMRAAATPRWAGKDYEPLFIQVPGERRFYARVALRDGITGLLSGARKIDVEVVALQVVCDPLEDAQKRVQTLQGIYKVALAAKKLERLCDILIPDELRQYVADLAPCTHKKRACNSYWHSVKEKLEQHTATSTTNHFGVILVPYQQ
jgi:hypothetical protein